MASGSVIRGARIGSGPLGEMERGEPAPRSWVSYWCEQGHETRPAFAEGPDVEVPAEWNCMRCGEPAGQDPENPPASVRNIPFKTHMAYVMERRTQEEGSELLNEALAALRARRGG